MRNILTLLLFLAIGISSSLGQTSNATLQKLFDQIDKSGGGGAESTLFRGQHPKGRWSSVSMARELAEADTARKFLQRLSAVDDASLNKQEKISKEVMLIRLNDQVAEADFQLFFIPFNAEGGFYNQMSGTLSRLPFNDTQNYKDYLDWIPQYENRLMEYLQLMREGMARGVVAPKAIANNTVKLIAVWAPEDFKQSPFYAPLTRIPGTVNESDKKEILSHADKVIGKLNSTFVSVRKFFETEYMRVAKDNPGIMFIPKGKTYYENRIKHYTTLPLTPDSVHALGLKEVARIRTAMDKIISDLKFQGSFADFLNFLRTDEQFYAKTPQDLLNRAAWLSKKAEGQLPKLFNKLYTLPFTVEPVPDAIAPTYTGGRYVPGSWDGKRAGTYWVNTYDLKSRTLYTLPSLTVHEAVPGHHLQGSLAAELKNIPAFRNRYYISAFGEGWGLYSEFLGEEMGMYSTPYEFFGRYTYEMWRACRLVVDTGIHYKGWSREQALKYLSENTALSIHECTTEIDRYIGWPGQAVSYKIGEIKIKELRRKAEQELGKSFNIGQFHDAILRNGSVPLTILEKEVDDYISEARKSVAKN